MAHDFDDSHRHVSDGSGGGGSVGPAPGKRSRTANLSPSRNAGAAEATGGSTSAASRTATDDPFAVHLSSAIMRKAEADQSANMAKLTGGLNLGGLF